MIVGMLVVGAFHGKAAAISVDDLLARIGALTAQVDGLMKRLNASKGTAATDVFLYDLRAGARNNGDVRKLQQFLIDNGYLQGSKATGNFLTLTRDAVRRFQSAAGLPVTGVFDRQTRDAVNGSIRNIARAVMSATSTPINGKTILIKTATSTALVRATSTIVEPPARPTTTGETYRTDPRPAYDTVAIERATFDAVNAERQKNGLYALRWNDRLADVARAHSSDQAGDNAVITNPDVACPYPYIRHEGFVAGFKVGDRLDNGNVPYSVAGENIIILPMTKELIYRATTTAPACKEFFDREGPVGETQDAAHARIQTSLSDRLSLMIGQSKLDWVNIQWKGTNEIASESATDWMNSPGHRHNILTPEFEEGAIGASIVNDYIIMTQVFLKGGY
jgi:uncharacterized protein YkwD